MITLNENLFGQFHFTFASNTGNNATIAIPAYSNPNVNGNTLSPGDEIGAFTPGGLCVGGIIWQNKSEAMTIWGDNPMTPVIDGIRDGEEIRFKFWIRSNNIEIPVTNIIYSQGNGIYQTNGIYIISNIFSVYSSLDNFSDNFNNSFSAEIYPNPVVSNLNLKINSKYNSEIKISIFDCLGRKQEGYSDSYFFTNSVLSLRTDNLLSNGIYFLVIEAFNRDENNKKIISKKFLLMK